ncbi:MAG: chromosome segregation protein SMC, partial [Oscillospiraceae bacterium]|nr:chromosome segregation protein SMC [Oscillospiraceae bacterium]
QALRQEGEILVLENTLEHNKAAVERIARERGHAGDGRRQLEAEIEAVLAQAGSLRQELGRKQEALLACAKRADRRREEEQALLSQGAALSQSLQAIAEQLAQRHIEQSAADSSMAELRSRIETIEQSGAARAAQARELEQQLQGSNRLLREHREALQGLQNSLQGYQLRAKNRTAKAEDARQELEHLRGEQKQLSARLKLLEDLEQNMEGYSGAVRALMKESARGGLKGLHGTLSQLIRVEPDYTLAVETALGPALQHIVTDDEGAAKRAIEYLKRGNAGRATFLPLTGIDARDFREAGLERCAGFIAMAQELVTCDSLYDTIVKAQLGRTAVAEDIDGAIAIAKRYSYRFRIVTLDGQVVNAGGSITGGSRSQGTGILSRGNEISRLKQEISQLERQITDQTARAKQLGEEAAAAQAASSGAQGDLARAQEDVIRQESHAGAVEARLQDAAAAQAELDSELAAAAGRVAQLEEARRMGDTRAAELEGRRLALGQQVDAAKTRQAELSRKREQSGQEESALRMELLGIEKDVESREELAAGLRQRRDGHAGRDRELLEEQASLEQGSLEIEEKIEELRGSVGQLREGAALGAAEGESLAAQREDLQARAETLRREERLQLGRKETLGGDLARQEERRALARQALDNAAAKLYDDYQVTPREAEAGGYRLEDPAGASIELSEVGQKIRALGNINVDAIEEYREVSERYGFLRAQVEDVERSREELTRLIEELTGKMSERFRAQFARINRYFGETFAELFSGGQAALELENPLDVLESAIDIRVQPPGKNVQNIDLLSGGEKGLSAIALLFAILKATPAPFCIFDEVEAALDDVNVARYARYVRRMTKNTQFILISHRRGTMEEADVLYGVTMQEEGVSKLLEMKTNEMAGKLGIE